MEFQEVHKNGLDTRKNLTEDQLKEILNQYFFNEEICKIIESVKDMVCWTNGNVGIINTGTVDNPKFTVGINENL